MHTTVGAQQYRGTPDVPRQTVSADVLRMAENLANHAQRLSDQVLGKLHPVMTQECPQPCGEVTKDGREFPPLFAELRSNFKTIEAALDSIEAAINRTEL